MHFGLGENEKTHEKHGAKIRFVEDEIFYQELHGSSRVFVRCLVAVLVEFGGFSSKNMFYYTILF